MTGTGRRSLAVLWRIVRPVVWSAALALIFVSMMLAEASDVPAGPGMRSGVASAAPVDRLAELVLFRLGEYRIGRDDEVGEGEPPKTTLELVSESTFRRCVDSRLVAGVVAAESYARSPFRRAAEYELASVWRGLTGRHPDWSYGIAQIRPSTAREALARALERAAPLLTVEPGFAITDEELVEATSDLCSAAFLAGLVVDPAGADDLTTQEAVDRYRGGPSIAELPGVVSYALLVDAVARRMTGAGIYSATSFVSVRAAEEATDADGWTPLVCIEHSDRDRPYASVVHLPAEAVASLGESGGHASSDSLRPAIEALRPRIREMRLDFAPDASPGALPARIAAGERLDLMQLQRALDILRVLDRLGLHLAPDAPTPNVRAPDEEIRCALEVSVRL